MNGVPEAVGVGVSKLVDINPAIGILVAVLLVIIGVLAKWGLDGWKAERLAKQAHLDYVSIELADARKTEERLDRIMENQTTRRAR